MNSVATVLTIAIPTFVVLIGILLNRQDYVRIGGSLEQLRQQWHQDMMLIMGRLSDLDTRLSRVEERMAR